ncbi:hypothetical protein ATY41_08605 [Leifsonia xyli subsp. xyli]|uniref:Uncharacterized protein n=1 Tax=Leifsonia xyli subsp. xyli TaxID=59736 RepID=A0A1E2SLW2_LEIXY|nr:hypothetical protein [Leifsonia xyli]ODA90825.1 hypothetical protein ATY41_08605 [Leifsonia xyli subsp. xyli]
MTFPFSSVTDNSEPHAGSSTVLEVHPTGFMVSTFVVGPVIAGGVYAVFVTRPSTSVTATGRPTASYVVVEATVHVFAIPDIPVTASVMVTSPASAPHPPQPRHKRCGHH